MTNKTDAEFIAECEAFIKSESEHGYYGEPPFLSEALKRLKRATESRLYVDGSRIIMKLHEDVNILCDNDMEDDPSKP